MKGVLAMASGLSKIEPFNAHLILILGKCKGLITICVVLLTFFNLSCIFVVFFLAF